MQYGSIGGWRRVVAVGLPALLVGASGAVTQWVRLSTRSANEAASQAHAITGRIGDVLQRLTDLESAQRAYLLTGDASAIRPWEDRSAGIQRDFDSLHTLAGTDAPEGPLVATLQRLVDLRLADLSRVVTVGPTGRRDSATRAAALETGRATMDSVRSVLARIRSDEEQVIAASALTLARRRATLNVVVLAGTTLAVIVALFVNALLTGYARDRERTATLLASQTREPEQQNAVFRRQATERAAANRELERTTAELQAASAELARTAAEGERARETAEMANRAKGDFLAAMSHELRMPLNAIVGYAALLKEGVRGPMSEDQHGDVTRIVRAARHLLGLINDLLNFARLDAGKLRIDRAAVPVDELLAAATAMMEVQARAKHLTLTRMPCDTSAVALADHDKTLQIVVNLLSNAVKFTAPGGRIDVVCAAEERRVFITVLGYWTRHRARAHCPHLRAVRPTRATVQQRGRRARPRHQSRSRPRHGRRPHGTKRGRHRVRLHPDAPPRERSHEPGARRRPSAGRRGPGPEVI